jgi:riboflavin synthase
MGQERNPSSNTKLRKIVWLSAEKAEGLHLPLEIQGCLNQVRTRSIQIMFSGIIERVAPITAIVASQSLAAEAAETCFTIATGFNDLVLGESVAVNGVCLTVTRRTDTGEADFYISPETLARTSLGQLNAYQKVNLERALQVHSRLSGHLVQGHVDGVASLHSVNPQANSHCLKVHLPSPLGKWCIEKGSITLDGISLTLNAVRDGDDGTFIELMIIPHTWEHTSLSERRVGDRLNVEVDVIAKYVERLTTWKN